MSKVSESSSMAKVAEVRLRMVAFGLFLAVEIVRGKRKMTDFHMYYHQ